MLQVKNFSFGHHILKDSFAHDDDQIRGFEMEHPLRTLLYELLLEPILRALQRVLDFVT